MSITTKPSFWRRTTARIWFGVLLVVLGAFALHHVSIDRQRSAFFAKTASMKEAGDAVLLADLTDSLRVGDDQNAALPLRRAVAMVPDADLDEAYWKEYLKHPFTLPLTDAERALAKRQVVNIDQISQEVEVAAAKPRSSWLPPPGREGKDFPLGGQRMVAEALGHAARLEADAGNPAAALDRVRQMRVIARAMQTEGTLTGYLVAVGVEAMALSILEDIGPHLTIGKPNGVSAARVRRMMVELEVESDLLAAIRLGYRGDRARMLENCQRLANGEPLEQMTLDLEDRLKLYINRPAIWSGSLKTIGAFGDILSAIDAADWPTCQALLERQVAQAPSSGSIEKMTEIVMPTNRSIARYRYESPTRRRLARTALAIHLYAADHEGRLPKSLDDLIPGYLPTVPVDLMASAAAPIKYVPTGEPVVYSIGKDGIDDNGAPTTTNVKSLQQLGQGPLRESGDISFRLTPRPRPPPEANNEQ